MPDASLKFNKEILDSITEGIYTIDMNFRITYMNKSAEILLNTTFESSVGQLCSKVCKSEFCEMECPVERVFKTNSNLFDIESKLVNNNGKLIPVKQNVSLLHDEKGNVSGAVISFRDSTKNLEINDYLLKHSEFYGIVGKSKGMMEIYKTITEIAESDASVFIYGETGVGKELIANAIQATSKRADKKYVKLNCSVFPANLLGSELFGHVKGAFTNAFTERVGRFEYADGGTIFLDEIAEMPLNTQTQLLRILQQGTFEKLGDSITRKVDVRIIGATNKNIIEEVKNKNFREDLYYRMSVVPIFIPPLRERRDDIPLLINFFIKKMSIIHGKPIEDIDDDALEALINFDWPGNIRELENAINYAFLRSKRNHSICICCLPKYIRDKKEEVTCYKFGKGSKNEIENILELLERYNGNKTKVASILGINRSTLWRKLKNNGY